MVSRRGRKDTIRREHFNRIKAQFALYDQSYVSLAGSCKLSPYRNQPLKSVVRENRALRLWEPEVGNYRRPLGGRSARAFLVSCLLK